MLEALKQEVLEANLALVRHQLVTLTWGNVSAITPDRQYIVIKPSGVDYAAMQAEQMVVVALDGTIAEGDCRPSSDLDTHLEIYRNFSGVNGVVHTHSTYATSMAQAETGLPCYGTTHADHFYGEVPCTRQLTAEEVGTQYELNTGKVIVETFQKRKIDPGAVPAVLVAKHGPFAWGPSAKKAVENAVALEATAHMALLTNLYVSAPSAAPQYLQDRHYFRKHGPNAYYGQK